MMWKCRRKRKKSKNTSTFHIGPFKNPLGNICRFFLFLFCQLKTFSFSFSCVNHDKKRERDWCVKKTWRKIIRREERYEKRLSGGTRSYPIFSPFLSIIKCFVIHLKVAEFIFALKNSINEETSFFSCVSWRREKEECRRQNDTQWQMESSR